MIKYSLFLEDKYCLEEQLKICRRLGFPYLEVAETINGTHFLDLKTENVKRSMYENKVFISMLNLKVWEGETELAYFKKLVKKCSSLGVECISICGYRSSMNPGLAGMLDYSRLYNIRVCLENKFGSGFNTNEQFSEISSMPRSRDLSVVFNPLEFSRDKEHPFLSIFYKARFKNKIMVLRINDGLFTDAVPKLPGDGNCEVKELISALKSRNFNGYYSFVPYFADQTVDDYEMIYKAFLKMASSM